jgi:hypothetical protein
MPTMNPYAPPTSDPGPTTWGPNESARALRRLRWLAGGVGLVGLLSLAGTIAQGVDLLERGVRPLGAQELVSVGLTAFITTLYGLTAWALWTRRPYGRILGLVSVVLSVCACPTGTVLTLWGVWVLTRPAVVALFTEPASGVGPHAGPR